MFEDVAKYLLHLGEQEILHGHKLAFTKWKGRAQPFMERLLSELMAYARNQYPFNAVFKDDVPRSCLKWWESLVGNGDAEILPHLSVKIYAICVNSMAEERTVSKMTWITPPLRSRLSGGSMVAMTQVGQYYQAKKHKVPRRSQNRFPVDRIGFCAVKRELFPTSDDVPSSLHDTEEDDTWLDEPSGVLAPETILVTAHGAVNMSSLLLTQMLADEPPTNIVEVNTDDVASGSGGAE